MALTEELEHCVEYLIGCGADQESAQWVVARVCRKSLEAAAAKDCLLCKQGVPMDGNKLHRYTLTGLTERCHASHIRSLLPPPPVQEDHK